MFLKGKALGSASFRKLEDGRIDLVVDYGVERDRSSWLEERGDPRMLVTGAAGFIGRYMVDLLVKLDYRVYATDLGSRPRWLDAERFARVEYSSADLREEEKIAFLMKWAQPDAVFHVGAIFDFSAPLELLREVNVAGSARVCEAARDAGARRVVYWSSGSIYAASDEPVAEAGAKAPLDPYARTKYEGEVALFDYHDPPEFEVYSVRPAMVSGILSRYGSGLVARLMHEGYLVGPPQRRGMTTAVVNARDVATCGYLAAAKSLDLPTGSPDDTAFNASADPVDVDSMMSTLSRFIPRRHILGVRTALAEIIGFGYQDEVRLPDRFVHLVGAASSLATHVLNRFRRVKLFPKIPPETVPYIIRAFNMSNAKARELLGWAPDPPDVDAAETARYYEETGWTGFERTSATEGEDSSALDEVTGLMRALRSGPRTEPEEERPRVEVPSLGLEIDERSLNILVRATESYLLERAYGGSLASLVGGAIPKLASHVLDDALRFLKHAYLGQFGDRGLNESEVPALLREALDLDKDKVVSWVLAANIAQFIERARGAGGVLGKLAALLPEGGYALFVETSFGDVAVEYRRDGDAGSVYFPCEEVRAVPGHLPLERRIERLRKSRGLKLVLGTGFEDIVGILSGGRDMGDAVKAFVASPKGVLRRVSERIERSGKTPLIFEDDEGRPALGVGLTGRVTFLSGERLEAFAIAKGLIGEEGFAEALDAASGGRERPGVYRIADFRRMLADAIDPGIVGRILGR